MKNFHGHPGTGQYEIVPSILIDICPCGICYHTRLENFFAGNCFSDVRELKLAGRSVKVISPEHIAGAHGIMARYSTRANEQIEVAILIKIVSRYARAADDFF